MSMSDTTRLPSSLSETDLPPVGGSSSRLFLMLSFIGMFIMTISALGLATHQGWFRTPPLPTAIVPIDWPQDPLITATARRPLSSHGLTPAPDPRLIEIIPEGTLPIRADDGATPLKIYARPLPPLIEANSKMPTVALILRGAGIGQLATLEASLRLPPDISFALSPYAREIGRQLDEIREEGHEVFLDIPVMSRNQGFEDLGPEALVPAAGEAENLARLKWSMARVAGYAGLLALPGSADIISADLKDLLFKQAEARGLGLIVHSPIEPLSLASQPEQAAIDISIARDAPAAMIDNALDQLTADAQHKGSAIGVAVITPLAIERLKKWSEGLSAKGVRLVPASAALMRAGQ